MSYTINGLNASIEQVVTNEGKYFELSPDGKHAESRYLYWKRFAEWLVYAEKMERIVGNVKPDENVGSNVYKDVGTRKIKLTYNRKNPTSRYEYDKTPM